MKKLLGIFSLLLVVFAGTALLNRQFISAYNLQNLVSWTSLFGIISIGAAFVIITGGIDLSIGSVIGLVGSLMAWLLTHQGWSVPLTLVTVLAVSLAIGLAHGLLITKVGLQPFVVTLCGLLLYRGIGRYITDDQSQGFGNGFDGLRQLAIGKLPVTGTFALPAPFFFLVVVALLAHVFLTRTIWGRYLLALGRNETAARFSGIPTERMKLLAYVVSLRGGEGTVIGVIIGTAVMRVLYNAINILGIPTHLELAIIGSVILAGVIADEVVKAFAARRRATREAEDAGG